MPKLLFNHIAKCGGTSAGRFFRAAAGDARVSPHIIGMPALIGLDYFKDYDVVSGHFTGRVLFKEFPNILHAVVLRDPVDRFVSQYYYQGEMHKKLPASALTLEALARRARNDSNPHADNQQTRNLAMAAGDMVDSCQWLEAAKRNLECFELIGLTDELPSFLADCAGAMGWKMPDGTFMARKNAIRPAVADLSRKTVDDIRRRLQLDLELVDFARDLVSRRRSGSAMPRQAIARTAGPKPTGDMNISLVSANGKRALHIMAAGGDEISLVFVLSSITAEGPLDVWLSLRYRRDGPVVSRQLFPRIIAIEKGKRRRLQAKFRLPFPSGAYTLEVAVGDGSARLPVIHAIKPHLLGIYARKAAKGPAPDFLALGWQLESI